MISLDRNPLAGERDCHRRAQPSSSFRNGAGRRMRGSWFLSLPLLILFVEVAVVAPVGAQTVITCGQTLTGDISAPGEQDTFTFSANAGEAVQIAAINTSGSLRAVAELYGPTANWLGSNGTGNGWSSSISLPSTGTYSIKVHDFMAPGTTGSYVITLQFTTGRCAVTISCGQVLSSSIGVGELDSFVFSGTAGEAVQLAAINTSGSLRSVTELYGPTGTWLGSNGTGNAWSSSISLSATGTYTIIVHNFQTPDAVGNYNLNLQFTTGRCGTAMGCGQLLAGSIGIGELNSFSFSGNSGEAVMLSAINTSGTLKAVTELYGPTGTWIGSNGTGNGRSSAISLTANGTYTVIVHHFQTPNATGNYNIGLQFTTGRCGAAIECGLNQGGTLAVGELDAYSFPASAGEAVVITTSPVSGTLSAVAALYGPTGLFVGDNGLGNSTSTTLPLTMTGTYTMVVYDWSTPTESGDYALRISCIGPPTGFMPLVPCRVFDTREWSGATAGAPVMSSGEHRQFTVTDKCGIPADARAISVNLTVVNAEAAGELRVIGGDLTDTTTSVLSIPISRGRANNAALQLARTGTGKILVINETSGTVHVILDVNGYFR